LFIDRAVDVWNSSASDVESQMNTGTFITGHDKAGVFPGWRLVKKTRKGEAMYF